MDLARLSDRLAVALQLRPRDIAELARSGFAGINNNRPDGEEPDQPTSSELEAQAKRHGLAYWHVPVAPSQMTNADARDFFATLGTANGPVLAFCRTGNRSTALWTVAPATS